MSLGILGSDRMIVDLFVSSEICFETNMTGCLKRSRNGLARPAVVEEAAGARSTDPSEFGMTQAAARPVVQFIARLQKDGGLKGTDIANFTGVSKATVSRWGSGRKSPHPKTQLIMSDLSYVVMRLSEYYGQEEVRAWLYARHPQLDGRRAIDLIHDDRTEEVIAILDRLEADVYL